jgi:hypothetical protein
MTAELPDVTAATALKAEYRVGEVGERPPQ